MKNLFDDLHSVPEKGRKKNESDKSILKTTAKTLLFAVLIIFFIRTFLFESFNITTPSMEGQLLVGDKVWVNKFRYGSRFPNVIKVPFLNDNWTPFRMLGLHLYITLFGTFRLPGYGSISRGDIIAFNLPEEDKPAIDLKTTYIKRCVGIPGDTLCIKNGKLTVNGAQEKQCDRYQYLYRIQTSAALTKAQIKNFGIRDANQIRRKQNFNVSDKFDYFLYADNDLINKIKNQRIFTKVQKDTMPYNYIDLNMYPHSISFPGNRDNVGPFLIPKMGMTIYLDSNNSSVYFQVLNRFEHLVNLKFNQKLIYLNNTKLTSYTFRNDYYFSMGDNRDNSYDSRYWGFVPKNHIIGNVMLVWFSNEKGSGIRWNRILKKVS